MYFVGRSGSPGVGRGGYGVATNGWSVSEPKEPGNTVWMDGRSTRANETPFEAILVCAAAARGAVRGCTTIRRQLLASSMEHIASTLLRGDMRYG